MWGVLRGGMLTPAELSCRLCISAVTDNLISCTPISEMSLSNMIAALTEGFSGIDLGAATYGEPGDVKHAFLAARGSEVIGSRSPSSICARPESWS